MEHGLANVGDVTHVQTLSKTYTLHLRLLPTAYCSEISVTVKHGKEQGVR